MHESRKGNVMNTMEIANKLVELCRQGKNTEALDTLYADDVVSVEAAVPPGMEREAKGLAAVRAKGQWWEENTTSAVSPNRCNASAMCCDQILASRILAPRKVYTLCSVCVAISAMHSAFRSGR